MANRTVLEFDRPGLFSSPRVRRILDDSGAVFRKNFQELADSNVASTSSFRYDPPTLGIRSTQQIPVDFSRFENHTFFNSAEVNVNVAFDRIINEYPFDGTRKEVETFVDSLTGFEKWVLDSFPTNVGYLHFTGSSYISVNDSSGRLYPELSKDRTGDAVLDPRFSSISFEMHLLVSGGSSNGHQVILQKMSGTQQGITLGVVQTSSPTVCNLIFGVTSGSQALSVSTQVSKGTFHHVCAEIDRRPLQNVVRIYVNENKVVESTSEVEFGPIDFAISPLTIGSGTQHARILSSSNFTPAATFAGALDELRVFHGLRSIRQQQLYGRKTVFASPDLKLYYKFNEPTGTIGRNDVVLDSSGHSLHSTVTNFSHSLRSTGSIGSPMSYEKRELNPVLFPAYVGVQDLNSRLLASASSYDEVNPNLITRLIPNHYLTEGQSFDGLDHELGTIGSGTIGGSGPPGSGELGSAQLLASFLYVWAKFFDELKMVIDLFGQTVHVDYDKNNTVADQFLPFLARYYGFEMPAFFVNSSIEQFVDAENIGDEISTNRYNLRYVQNQIWRRILTNIGEVVRSKGTLHSVKVLLRSLGVDPDSGFRIREYGGPTRRALTNAREPKSDIGTLLEFSSSIASVSNPATVDSFGIHAERPFLRSPFLLTTRTEPGFPQSSGVASDGLLTSGSWTFEASYRWPALLTGSHAASQSLARMFVTGTSAARGGLIVNAVATSGSHVTLHAAPGFAANSGLLELVLTGVNVMDGKLWNISFGRQRNDDGLESIASSSYFLRAARSDFGRVVESHVTSSFFFPVTASSDAQQIISTTRNASGAFIVIGSQSIDTTLTVYLNASGTSGARQTDFSGRLGQVRFWSKALEEDEWLEHVRNPRSVGVDDPLTNFNFVRTATGSFGRLRIDASAEQPVSRSGAGRTFELFDFSQNSYHLTGTGFEANTVVLAPERLFYSQLSPRFDEASSDDKVRIRSFQSFRNVQLFGGEVAPVHSIVPSEKPEDDTRFSIDFSIMDALNEDIIRIFSSLDALDNILGDPELVFAPDYPGLEDLRDVYFNRLTEKVRLRRFFEFFKWFDSVLGISYLIEQLVPRKTRFLGTNFVVESHMLERPKFEYQFADIYVGENDRHGLKGTILLQQFSGLLRRY